MATRKRPAPALSPLEHEVMQAVWSSGPCGVEAVHAAVSRSRDLKEVTTRTVLRRLEQKGHLQHDVEGRAYIYRAVEPPRSIAARAVRQLIDRFCNGSVEELVSGIVEAKVLSQAELARLEESVKARPRAGTSSRKGR
jgi:BlaI family transcriptional regulator, penicillinase repressor